MHLVESMFSVNETPWHGLGNLLTHAPTIHDAINQAGLDWQVNKVPVYLADGTEINGRKALVRSTDNSVLGVMSNRYEPLQNANAFEWFQPFLDSELVSLETAGSLNEGKKVWVMAKIQGDRDVKGIDPISRYILLSNSHDGTQAIRVGFTPIRVVCQNTMTYAHNSAASKLLSVRHTANHLNALDDIRETMNVINQTFDATIEQYNRLASYGITSEQLERYVKISLGYNPDAELSNKANHQVNKVIELFETGQGTDLSTAKGTVFGAYNAITEYFSHYANSNASSRYNSLWFGSNAKKSQDALELALKLAA